MRLCFDFPFKGLGELPTPSLPEDSSDCTAPHRKRLYFLIQFSVIQFDLYRSLLSKQLAGAVVVLIALQLEDLYGGRGRESACRDIKEFNTESWQPSVAAEFGCLEVTPPSRGPSRAFTCDAAALAALGPFFFELFSIRKCCEQLSELRAEYPGGYSAVFAEQVLTNFLVTSYSCTDSMRLVARRRRLRRLARGARQLPTART